MLPRGERVMRLVGYCHLRAQNHTGHDDRACGGFVCSSVATTATGSRTPNIASVMCVDAFLRTTRLFVSFCVAF